MRRYNDIRQIRNTNEFVGTIGDRYYRTVYYPEVVASETDIYVETEFGDRFDRLAFQFYGDVTLYWIIAIANPNYVNFGSIYINEGTQIRIPVDVDGILRSYNRINQR